jgi:thiol-disulfide isomerase/thioredoxin
MLILTLYTRPGCCLCDEMKTVLMQVQQTKPFSFEEIDISTDPALIARYGEEIPVLYVNGRKAFKYQVTAGELHQRLAREAGVRMSRND